MPRAPRVMLTLLMAVVDRGARRFDQSSMKVERLFVPLGAIAIALLYTVSLGHAPIYLSHDEVFFGIHAAAIATTGRDLNGSVLPVYFQIWDRYGAAGASPVYWAQPLHIYSQALFVRIFSLSEAVV